MLLIWQSHFFCIYLLKIFERGISLWYYVTRKSDVSRPKTTNENGNRMRTNSKLNVLTPNTYDNEYTYRTTSSVAGTYFRTYVIWGDNQLFIQSTEGDAGKIIKKRRTPVAIGISAVWTDYKTIYDSAEMRNLIIIKGITGLGRNLRIKDPANP